MMQIVIDIPEDDYNIIKNSNAPMTWVEHLIKDGTPLPKGHGRIGDFDAVLECIKECSGEDAIWAVSLIEWACKKRTIIPAERSDVE